MNNVESLKKLIQDMANNKDHLDNLDMITGYLASIACSLAIIADKIEEKEEKL